MSVKIVHEEIKRFLKSSESEVLCLKGKWGVGKTYAWNYYLHEAAVARELGLDRYSYVSLFGLKSLEDIKYSLFEETIEVKDLAKGVSFSSVEKSFNWLKKNYRKGAGIISRLPLLQSYLGSSEKSLFFLVRRQIICIDDLERAGSGLETKDILGLISYLKEQRGCKVVLLLNEEKLSELSKAAFAEQLEKVVDTKLDFNPTPTEAADIVFPNPVGLSKLLHTNCIKLGITNIRVIKKIERITKRLEEIFGKNSPLMTQIAHSTALLGWCVYQPDEAPSIEFIKDFARVHGLTHDKDKTPANERIWQELLRSYDYSSSDEFDLKILETITNGYFDNDALKASGEKQINNLQEINNQKAFSEAWNLYHDSFDANESTVLEALYSSAKNNVKSIEPINLDSTVSFLKEFGKDEEAKSLLAHYISVRAEERDLFDLGRSIFSRDVKDPDVIRAFKEKSDSFKDSRNPGQVLAEIAVNRGWNPEDIDLINTLTTENFYTLFKETKGVDLHRIIRSTLDFKNIGGISDATHSIADKAIIALKKIGQESKLNAKRVATRGIKVDEIASESKESSL